MDSIPLALRQVNESPDRIRSMTALGRAVSRSLMKSRAKPRAANGAYTHCRVMRMEGVGGVRAVQPTRIFVTGSGPPKPPAGARRTDLGGEVVQLLEVGVHNDLLLVGVLEGLDSRQWRVLPCGKARRRKRQRVAGGRPAEPRTGARYPSAHALVTRGDAVRHAIVA